MYIFHFYNYIYCFFILTLWRSHCWQSCPSSPLTLPTPPSRLHLPALHSTWILLLLLSTTSHDSTSSTWLQSSVNHLHLLLSSLSTKGHHSAIGSKAPPIHQGNPSSCSISITSTETMAAHNNKLTITKLQLCSSLCTQVWAPSCNSPTIPPCTPIITACVSIPSHVHKQPALPSIPHRCRHSLSASATPSTAAA
jgi:hypothetical protein